MVDVDYVEKNNKNYRIGIRSYKWWELVFVFCLNISMHNSWQLYRRNKANKEIIFLTFRPNVVQIYLTKYNTLSSLGIYLKL